MSISNMKEIDFPKASYDEWKEAATKALKGKPFESLFTKTTEGITLEPLYTQESLVEKLGAELDKQISTIRQLKATDEFLAAQQIYGETAEKFFANLQDSLDRGNNVITIESRVSFEWNDDNLVKLASFLTENSFKFIVQGANDPLLAVFNEINENERQNVKGYIVSPENITLNDYPNVRTYGANTLPYHYDGANAIQELAIALGLAAKYSELEEDFQSFSEKFFVQFAVDTQFFSEIAKIRAFKVLWKAFTSAYGVEENVPVVVLGETSLRSFSKLDIYVNLLRSGNEAFAALIGGTDVFTVHPHDVLTKPTDQSIRIARNVALVLKEESRVADVLDPSGGSYYIETLTAEFVEKAWAMFLEIQDAGGIDAYVQAGTLQKAIDEVYNSRVQAVETRKHSLIGTNIYANPVDELPKEVNPIYEDIKRLAVPFEQLREQYAELQPKIAILTYGQLKNFKPRADFVSGFFATAGVVPETSGEIQSVESAIEWIKNCDSDYVVIAATDDDVKQIVQPLLAEKREGLILDVAGKFKEEEEAWVSSGLNGFIFAGQNIVEKLTSVCESIKEVQR